jgi:hypothetical protein
MVDQKHFRIALRVPEIFYVLRNPESHEPDRFLAEEELIKKHQSDEESESLISEDVQLGHNQINAICKALQSEFTTETKNISSFKNYVHNLESTSREDSILEVKLLLQEMRRITQEYKGNNLSSFFLSHWAHHGEDFYFILHSIELAGIRIVRDSRLLEKLSDEQKIDLYLETY